MFKASFVYLASSIFRKLSPFLLMPIITNTLTPSEFGIGSLYISSIAFISVIVGMGTQSVIPKFFYSENKKQFSKICFHVIFSVSLISLILVSIVTILSPSEYRYANVLVVVASLGLVFINALLSLYRTKESIKLYFIFEIMFTLFIFVSVIFSIKNFDANYYAWLLPVVIVHSLLGIVALLLFLTDVRVTFGLDKNIFNQLVNLCLPIIPHSIALTIIGLSDRYLIGFFLEPEKAAYYILAANLATGVKVFSDAFMKAWNPFYFKNYSNELLISKYKKIFISVLILVSIVYSLLVYLLFEYFFPESYSDAKYILPVLALSYVIFSLYQLNVSVVLRLSITKYLKRITPFAAILNFLINLIFIPIFGVFVAAFSTSVAYAYMVITSDRAINNEGK